MRKLAQDIRRWRSLYCLTQERAALQMGVSGRTWARWEREETAPSSNNLRELRELIALPPRGWLRYELDDAGAEREPADA